MANSPERTRGFTLIELLVILAIVGILMTVGVLTLGDRRGNAVRGLMDEVEGVVLAAQRNTVATGADISLQASGRWMDGTLTIDGRRPDPASPTARLGSESELFRSRFTTGDRIHISAGIDSGDGYLVALGTAPGLEKIAPGNAEPFLSALGNNLCDGTIKSITISGLTKRFNTGFCVVITGLRGGAVAANGPVGVVVVPANMANVFKFYKPEGETQWRRM